MRYPKRYRPVQGMLEWAFNNECAQLELPDLRDHEDRGFGFGSEYVMIQRAKLGGVQIDGGGPKHRDVAEDAEAVAAIVSNIPDSLGGHRAAIYISELAKSGLTPDWMPDAQPQIEPVEWVSRKGKRQGKAMLLRVYTEILRRPHPKNPAMFINQPKKHEIWWTPCTWINEPRTIEAARAEYAHWWQILDYIRDALQNVGMLRESVVTDAMPPKRPWDKPAKARE